MYTFWVFIVKFEHIQYVNLVFVSTFEHVIACWDCVVFFQDFNQGVYFNRCFLEASLSVLHPAANELNELIVNFA